MAVRQAEDDGREIRAAGQRDDRNLVRTTFAESVILVAPESGAGQHLIGGDGEAGAAILVGDEIMAGMRDAERGPGRATDVVLVAKYGKARVPATCRANLGRGSRDQLECAKALVRALSADGNQRQAEGSGLHGSGP